MSVIRTWLKGKKTYLVAAATVLGAVIAYASGETELGKVIEAVLAAILASTLRAGVNSDIQKALVE